MANSSILAAFERMWQHIVVALNNKSDKTDVEALQEKVGDTAVSTQIDDAINTLVEGDIKNLESALQSHIYPNVLYRLPAETVFDGSAGQAIDTGVKLFDTAKDFTIFVDATAVPENYNLALLDCAWDSRADTAIIYKGGVEVKTTGSAWFGNGFRICGNPANGAAEVFGFVNTTERTKMVVVYTQGIPSKWYYRTASATDITSKDPDTTSGVWDYVQHDGNAFIGGTMKNHERFIGTIHELEIYNIALTAEEVEDRMGGEERNINNAIAKKSQVQIITWEADD